MSISEEEDDDSIVVCGDGASDKDCLVAVSVVLVEEDCWPRHIVVVIALVEVGAIMYAGHFDRKERQEMREMDRVIIIMTMVVSLLLWDGLSWKQRRIR